MKKTIFSLVILSFASIHVFSQSSEQLSQIIKAEKISYAQASYLPALQANLISEEESSGAASPDRAAFEALKSNGYFSGAASADSEITLGELSGLYMKAMGIKGGLFYTITKSPRYAFKELKAHGILPSEADPSMTLSGRDAMDIFSGCLELTGDNE